MLTLVVNQSLFIAVLGINTNTRPNLGTFSTSNHEDCGHMGFQCTDFAFLKTSFPKKIYISKISFGLISILRYLFFFQEINNQRACNTANTV